MKKTKVFHANFASTSRHNFGQKPRNSQFKLEKWSFQNFLKTNSTKPPINRFSGSSSFANAPLEKGIGERHVCQICKRVGHQASRCFALPVMLNKTYKGESVFGSTHAFSANVNSSSTPDNAWLLDSGASHHLTSDLTNVAQSLPYNGSEEATLSNGNILPIHCVDSGLLFSTHNTCFLTLKHILRTLHTTYNLLSVHKLCADNDACVEFHAYVFYVKDNTTKKVLLKGGL